MYLYSGVINVYKPKGISSYDVIRGIKKIIGRKEKIGHTGTLDPDAQGILPVCIGKATKLSSLLVDCKKEYVAVCRLGICTDTEDIGGNVTATADVPVITDASLNSMVGSFTGEISQIPPMYSALKHNGVALYRLARNGQEIERKPRGVTIYSIQILNFDGRDIAFKVLCSKGTYIRSLCRDIGGYFGCGACMYSLERTAVGDFNKQNCVIFEELMDMSVEELRQRFIPIDCLFSQYPPLYADSLVEKRFINGAASRTKFSSGVYRLYSRESGVFLGLALVNGESLTQKQLFV